MWPAPSQPGKGHGEDPKQVDGHQWHDIRNLMNSRVGDKLEQLRGAVDGQQVKKQRGNKIKVPAGQSYTAEEDEENSDPEEEEEAEDSEVDLEPEDSLLSSWVICGCHLHWQMFCGSGRKKT